MTESVTLPTYLSSKQIEIKKIKTLNPQIAAALKSISNDYDLLEYVKDNIEFFISEELISEDWFSLFLPDTLKYLNIFTSGNNNVLTPKKNFTALVFNCHLSLDVMSGAAEIKTFGKAYLEARLMGRSATVIKLYSKSTAEVSVSGLALASISTHGKSNLNIENHNDSLVMVIHKSEGDLTSQGNNQLLIK